MFNKRNKKNYTFPRLEMHITDHCNLNCLGCAHYSNIAPEFYLSIDIFEKDLKEITKKLNYKLLNILGGEPLLHPEINLFLNKARKICPHTKITISTNGILLPEMDESFWQTLKKNGIEIRLSIYPVTIANAKTYINLIHKHKVKLCEIWDGRKFYLRRNKFANSDENILYKNCDAKICHQLHSGTLYPCPTSAYGHFYNEYFKNDFFPSKGINIYENSSENIYNFLTHPIKDCKTCLIKGKIINWEITKYNEKEWDAE